MHAFHRRLRDGTPCYGWTTHWRTHPPGSWTLCSWDNGSSSYLRPMYLGSRVLGMSPGFIPTGGRSCCLVKDVESRFHEVTQFHLGSDRIGLPLPLIQVNRVVLFTVWSSICFLNCSYLGPAHRLVRVQQVVKLLWLSHSKTYITWCSLKPWFQNGRLTRG